ncbi:MAG TPA: hypothetical protein VE396_00960 [Xanthobacteraceae bacterium]|jgi:hypothetical protein|nr:hypothetical protein [Xanthobacteraceae bacterium]
MPDDITIRGQATLEWGDQIRVLTRPVAKMLLRFAAFMVVMFGAIWALTLPDEEWLALRESPMSSLGRFVADVWPFYLGTFAVLVIVMIGHYFFAFRRYPHVNRQLSYEVTATGILTRDAADFALMVPWASIIRTRNTSRSLQTVTRAWRHVLWRAFAPRDRDQILRWATRQRASEPVPPS